MTKREVIVDALADTLQAAGHEVHRLDDFDPVEDVAEFDDEDDADECGLMEDGQCAYAGSEHCDFECSWRDSDRFAGSAAWCRKHGEKP